MLALIGKDLWTIGIPIAEKAVRTAAVYAGILILLRLGGKRDLAQLNSFDLVVLLLLSNVVQNAIIGNDNSLAGGMLGATILVALNGLVVRLVRRNDTAVKLFEGGATLLVENGTVDHGALLRLGLRHADIEVAVRRQGADHVGQVERASLEPGGTLLVNLRQEDHDATRSDIARLEAKLDELIARMGPRP